MAQGYRQGLHHCVDSVQNVWTIPVQQSSHQHFLALLGEAVGYSIRGGADWASILREAAWDLSPALDFEMWSHYLIIKVQGIKKNIHLNSISKLHPYGDLSLSPPKKRQQINFWF